MIGQDRAGSFKGFVSAWGMLAQFAGKCRKSAPESIVSTGDGRGRERAVSRTWTNLIGGVGLTMRSRGYRYLALVLFLIALTVYAFTLPASYTGGVIGLVSLQQMTIELAFFSIAVSVLLSLVLTLNVYAARASVRRRGGALSLGAVAASLLPATLCCTPVVPTVLALLGASTPQIFGLSGRIQGIFAIYQPLFLALALALLLLALNLAARNAMGFCPIPSTRTNLDGQTQT